MPPQMKKPIEVTTPGDTDVVVIRTFDAPPDLVFRAFTEPDLVKRWLGGYPGWTMPVCEIDLRVGGTYRYRWRNDGDGSEFGFTGTYKTIEKPGLIVHSEKPEDTDMGDALTTTEFLPQNGGTLMKMTIRYASDAIRQQAIATGMTDGMGVSFDQLDTLLAEKRPA
jgi:uncharacterized protein YndB with AHSA1/START domain